jgi:hypothetical protein
MCLAAVLLTAGFLNAADLRYKASGPWQDVEGVDGITGHGWQNALLLPPGTADTARANWGGGTITLNYATTIARYQAGVDESGIFQIQSGGSLTVTTGSTIGNNNKCTGTMNIDAGGLVTVNNWARVAGGNGNTAAGGVYGPTIGILNVNGTLTTTSHLWCATGSANTLYPGIFPTCIATININDGGIINVGGNIGLGTGDASNQSTGMGPATINLNGGLLNLYQWSDWNTSTNKGSIQPGSVINIKFGRIVINGNKVAATNTYAGLGRIKAFDGAGTVNAVFNSATNKTTITGISPMQPSPVYGSTVPDGTVTLGWKNRDPNTQGDPVYVDVWFGTDATWIPEPNALLPGYPGYYVDFAKVVAGQNTTTVNVAAPVIGTAPTKYYWRVDSYIYGAAHIGDPNFPVVTGDLFRFDVTNDFAPTVVIDTPNTVTWNGQPVQMNATVSDTGSSALTITWSANNPNAVFTPSASVEDPVVTVSNLTTFPTTVVLTCSVKDALNPQTNTATRNVVVYADACLAARVGAGLAAAYRMDLAEPYCVINMADLAVIAADWLIDYTLLAPTVIP